MIRFVQRSAWFVSLVLVQVLILNHIHIEGYAMPVLYIYYILVLDAGTPRKSLLLQAFALGLCVDIFSNTPGMNAAASAFLALIRPSLLSMMMIRDAGDDYEPGIRSMGVSPFFRYVLMGTLIHLSILQLIDFFSFFRPGEMLLKIITGSAVTVAVSLCLDAMRRKK